MCFDFFTSGQFKNPIFDSNNFLFLTSIFIPSGSVNELGGDTLPLGLSAGVFKQKILTL